MIYPPKKRAYSPEPIVTKDLSHLVNINSKFTGSGGSIYFEIQTLLLSLQRNKNLSPGQSFPGSLRNKSTLAFTQKTAR